MLRGTAARSTVAAILVLACSANACGDDAAGGAGPSSSATGGAGGGLPTLPTLDPSACPIGADGADPTIASAAESQWSIDDVAPAGSSYEEQKAFFFATLLREDDALMSELADDEVLGPIAADREARLRAALAQCHDDAACYTTALGWSEADATTAGQALANHLEAHGELASLADSMRRSGRFALHASLSDDELVMAAWGDLTVASNATLGDELGSLGAAKLGEVTSSVEAAHASPFAFFEPLLEVDLAALTADGRDEASRYEPLATGENAAALAKIPSIDWSAFSFTVVLVPGQGPSEEGVELDPAGQFRCDLAAQRYDAGIAPIIVVSGGHVHPDRTPYSEAIEMKKYLVGAKGIPDDSILVDPHARHTTTNLRNVSRLLYRYGVPTDRPLVVTSDFGQSIYIGYWHGTFGPRCQTELGYLPWRSLVPISQYDACMIPVAISLHQDGRDPLDP